MPSRVRGFTAKDLAMTTVFTVLVCVATIILKVDIPQTRGYFNIGDSFVYITALLFGPIIGGLAGGLGSMLADLILGAPWYAPGTLVVKGIEGLLVGYISHKSNPLERWKRLWRLLTVFFSILLAFAIYEFGTLFYSAEWQFTPLGMYVGAIQTTPSFWMIVALLLEAFLVYVGVGLDPRVVWQGSAIIVGGVEMIVGYLLYEFYVLGFGYYSFYEVPFNIGQAIIGLALAIPTVKAIERALQPSGSQT